MNECPEKGTILKEILSSNHHFSGDMLVFKGVCLRSLTTKTPRGGICLPNHQFYSGYVSFQGGVMLVLVVF